jgi:hypothetical protein
MTMITRQGEAGSLIHVAGEDQQFALPGALWPAGCDRATQALMTRVLASADLRESSSLPELLLLSTRRR